MAMNQQVAARVEELLREQLAERGVYISKLEPHEITQNMRCDVYPDETMIYSWKEEPVLRVVPERAEDGTIVNYRMFTGDDMPEVAKEAPVQ